MRWHLFWFGARMTWFVFGIIALMSNLVARNWEAVCWSVLFIGLVMPSRRPRWTRS